MKLAGRTMTAVGVLCAGLTLTACGASTQSSSDAGSSPTSSPTASPSASDSPSASPSAKASHSSSASQPSSGSSSTASSGSGGSGSSGGSDSPGSSTSLAKCTVSDVRARIVAGNPGAGQRYASIVLTNSGSTSCTIFGYGGMQLESSAGKVPTNLQRTAPGPKTITVKPGASASSLIHWTVVPSGSESSTGACEPTATSALVTPPDETHSLTVAWTMGPVCGKGSIQQDPYVPGTGG